VTGRAACPGCGQELTEGESRCLRCDYYEDRQRWNGRPVPPRRPRPPAPPPPPPPPPPDPLEEILRLRRNLEARTAALVEARAARVPPRARVPAKPVQKYRKRKPRPASHGSLPADKPRPASPAERLRALARASTSERLSAESRFLDQRNEAADRYFLSVLQRVAPEPDTDPDNWPLVYDRKGS